MKRIYLDNAATTAVAPEVIERINETNSKYFGNPSSVHTIGQESRHVLDEARRSIADFFGAKSEEIVFTSGGSESDNLAIRGVVESVIARSEASDEAISRERLPRQPIDTGLARNDKILKPHIITSAMEHHAVLHTIEDLEKEGKIEATYIRPDKNGIVSAEMVEKEIRENTILVSIMYVNNETGVVTPIEQIGEMIRGKNTEYRIQNTANKKLNSESLILNPRRIYFHTNAV